MFAATAIIYAFIREHRGRLATRVQEASDLTGSH
jgi:hypothetical protein